MHCFRGSGSAGTHVFISWIGNGAVGVSGLRHPDARNLRHEVFSSPEAPAGQINLLLSRPGLFRGKLSCVFFHGLSSSPAAGNQKRKRSRSQGQSPSQHRLFLPSGLITIFNISSIASESFSHKGVSVRLKVKISDANLVSFPFQEDTRCIEFSDRNKPLAFPSLPLK